jgi:hypothetical protein
MFVRTFFFTNASSRFRRTRSGLLAVDNEAAGFQRSDAIPLGLVLPVIFRWNLIHQSGDDEPRTGVRGYDSFSRAMGSA